MLPNKANLTSRPSTFTGTSRPSTFTGTSRLSTFTNPRGWLSPTLEVR